MQRSASGLPFDDIRALLDKLPAFDAAAAEAARARDATLTKPPGSLGRLEEIAAWVAGWQGRHPPRIDQPLAVVFAGNHGVVAQGVAPYPQAVTRQMVANFQAGGAAVNQLCQALGIGLKVFELALEKPTRDISETAAMEEAECAGTIAYGMEAVAGDVDLLCVGEMGIGNTTIAAALCHGLYGGEATDWVGPGTGLDAEGVRRKAEVVRRAVALHRNHLGDPLELMRRLGGREQAAMLGAILAARIQRVPVVLDGYVATASAAVLKAMRLDALDHCIAGHRSAEPAHARLLERLQMKPLLDLGMRLGEASGAVLAAGVIKSACATHNGMATFAEAGVSDRE